MYFDPSLRKLSFVFLLTAVMVLLVTHSVITVESHTEDFREARFALARAEANLAYTIFYKLPYEGQRLFAAAIAGTIGDAAAGPLSGTAKSVPVLVYHGENAATTTM